MQKNDLYVRNAILSKIKPKYPHIILFFPEKHSLYFSMMPAPEPPSRELLNAAAAPLTEANSIQFNTLSSFIKMFIKALF